ncbi:MAG: hypothetical protein WKF30_17180 [Pyrinomonadaceae bacterium]
MFAVEKAQGAELALHVRCDTGCGRRYELKVEGVDYQRYVERVEVIQKVFPYLAAPMRELLISGVCPRCWQELFGADDTSVEKHSDEDD